MPEHELLGPWLRRFLTEYIVTERNLARNTRSSYRDTFRLLLPFASQKVRRPVDRLMVRDLASSLVLKFLAHVEDDRGCSVRTRNQRLAGIKAFARFVGSRDPAHVEWYGHIRAISSKKSMQPSVGWLTRPEMEAMLAVPDKKTARGRHEYALLLFLYNTGARVHPKCWHRDEGQTRSIPRPTLIAAVTDGAGALQGVHRTWLAPDGQGKAVVKTQRRAMGHLLGNAVRLP